MLNFILGMIAMWIMMRLVRAVFGKIEIVVEDDDDGSQ